MIKRFILAVFAVLTVLVMPVSCSAYDDTYPDGGQILNDLGGNSLKEGLPDDAADFMDEHELSPENIGKEINITPDKILRYIGDMFVSELKKLPSLAARLTAAVIVCSMSSSVTEGAAEKTTSKLFGTITAAVCMIISVPEVTDCMDHAFSTLEEGGNFMMCYAPVYAAVSAAGGGIVSSSAYSIAVICSAEISVQLVKSVFYPLISIMLALGVAEGISGEFRMSGFTSLIKKVVSFGTILVMTVFTALISLQSFAGTSADTVTAKAVKLAASNLIPIVGGAVSDAYGTVKASFGVLRSGVGIFGIIAVCVIIIPPLLRIAAYRLIFMIAGAAASAVDCGAMKAFLSCADDVLSMIFSLLMSFSVMFIVSTAVVLSAGMTLAGG